MRSLVPARRGPESLLVMVTLLIGLGSTVYMFADTAELHQVFKNGSEIVRNNAALAVTSQDGRNISNTTRGISEQGQILKQSDCCGYDSGCGQYSVFQRGIKEELLGIGVNACRCPKLPNAVVTWDAKLLCRLLGHRRILFIGDSTSQQLAASLVNMIQLGHGECATQISWGHSDTLIGSEHGHMNRGMTWSEWLDKQQTDIVIFGVGPHIRDIHVWKSIVSNVTSSYQKHWGQHLILLWHTIFDGECNHKPAPEEWGYAETRERNDWMKTEMKRLDIPILDVGETTFHPEAWGGPEDCLHRCFPQGFLKPWNSLLVLLPTLAMPRPYRPPLCMRTPFFGRHGNRMITLANAIWRAKSNHSVVALDTGWSAWYRDWFDNRPDVSLDYSGPCGESLTSRDLFYMFSYKTHNSVLPTLIPSKDIRDKAESAYSQRPFVSVHRRAHPSCSMKNGNTLCNNGVYGPACAYTETTVRHIVGETAPIVLFTDGLDPTRDNTFAKRDHHSFQQQMWGMVLSERHFGNPLSSMDYVVAHWRKDTAVEPTACFAQLHETKSFASATKCFKNGNTYRWSLADASEPLAMNLCSGTSCVPVKRDGEFFVGTINHPGERVFARWMWRDLDWSKQVSRTTKDFQWDGCNIADNYKNEDVCVWTIDKAPEVARKSTPLTAMPYLHSFDAEYWIGDSTMKRLFDARKNQCQIVSNNVQRGKLHADGHETCDAAKLHYTWSAGFDDTVARIKNVPVSSRTLLVTNAGHNYINMNAKDFTHFMQRLGDTLRMFPFVAFIGPPAMNTDWWDTKLRCMRNNVIVQKRIAEIHSNVPETRYVDMFWSTLGSGKAVDGIHYQGDVYAATIGRIAAQLRTQINTTGHSEDASTQEGLVQLQSERDAVSKTCWDAYQSNVDATKATEFVPGKSVMMEPTSVKMMCELLTPSTRVLEWGSGGSTLFFSKFVKSWDSVEHDAAWIPSMQTFLASRPDLPVTYHPVPVAYDWKRHGIKECPDLTSVVCSESDKCKQCAWFADYVALPQTLGRTYDVVVVDGRARVSCVHAAAPLLAPNGVVVIHDWERPWYKSVLGDWEIVREDTVGPRHLAVLRPKQRHVVTIMSSSLLDK